MTKGTTERTYQIGGNGGSFLSLNLPDFEITNQRNTKTPEHQLVFDKSGDEVGLRILTVSGIGNVSYTDRSGNIVKERNTELVTARVGRREVVVPLVMLKVYGQKWAWMNAEAEERIPAKKIVETADHCESLYEERGTGASA